jgi:hypothetical protein
MLQLHLPKVAHHLRAAGVSAVEDQPFTDEATPEESYRQRDRRESFPRDFCDWHRPFLRQRLQQSCYQKTGALKSIGFRRTRCAGMTTGRHMVHSADKKAAECR